MSERILLVIPAFNAGKTLAPVLQACGGQSREIVVVNDGSSDDTGAVAAATGAHVLTHPRNRGKGAALKTAFAYAVEKGYEAVITLDADGQHLPHEIPKLVAAWKTTGADLIIGGRSHHFEAMIPRRRAANRFSAWAIARMSRTAVTDSQSGFRLYTARLLRAVRLRSDGFALESEVIVRAGVDGFPIHTVPIDLGFANGLATSHYRPVLDTLRIAWAVFRTRLLWR